MWSSITLMLSRQSYCNWIGALCVSVYKNSVLLQTQCLLAATERSKIIKTTVWSSSEHKGRIQRSGKALGTTHFQLRAFALTHDSKQFFHILLNVEHKLL